MIPISYFGLHIKSGQAYKYDLLSLTMHNRKNMYKKRKEIELDT